MHTEHNMTPLELRNFGLVTGSLIILLIGGLLPWLWHRDILQWQTITAPLGMSIIIWALLHPSSLQWVYKPWMFVADKIGWVNTRIILLLLFYVIIMPTGLVMRMFGTDPMARRFDSTASTYRVIKAPQSKDHMETPY